MGKMLYFGNLDVCDYVKRHDLVFLSPVCDPLYQGIPLGDGDTGVLFHLKPNAITCNINKTDLFGLGESEDGYTWLSTADSNKKTVAVQGAEFSLDFGCPLFDPIYSQSFESRLDLAAATARLHTQTPFATLDMTVFCSHKTGTAVLNGCVTYREDMSLKLRLERWGSRTLNYWYAVIDGKSEDGLKGTEASCGENILNIVQRLKGKNFCVSVYYDFAANATVENSHVVTAEKVAAESHPFTLFIAVGVGETDAEAMNVAHGKIHAARNAGVEALYADHCAEWHAFWNKSFVSLPKEMDFVENLWYLDLYYANSEMRGVAPAHFCNGIWNNYHDFVPWNLLFHYNNQLATFPLEAANHPELLETYYNYRAGQLPYAMQYAKNKQGRPGAFYSDVCDYVGRIQPDFDGNTTHGSQTAMQLYTPYQYSKKDSDLQRALPVMRATAEYYLDMLTLGEDGYYHIHNTTGYEGSPLMNDTITDLVMIRVLFTALIPHLTEEEAAPFRDRLEKLVNFKTTDFVDGEVKDGLFQYGIGKGKPIADEKVLSVGVNAGDGTVMRRTYGPAELDYYGFPDTEMAPIYPAGLVGLKDKGTRLFDQIKNSVYLHRNCKTPESLKKEDTYGKLCMGWCLQTLYLARMGMAEELWEYLQDYAATWTAWPNGMSQEGPYENYTADNILRFKKYRTIDHNTGKKNVAVHAFPYRHFNYESLPILTASVNEMLMQSYDGIIRLFPAIKEESTVHFTLAATGGFLVTAHYDRGEYAVCIASSLGGVCHIALADFAAALKCCTVNGTAVDIVLENGVYTVHTNAGDVVWIRSEKAKADMDTVAMKINDGPKFLGKAQLGEEQSYCG